MTRSELLALITDRLADNTTGQISEADQREVTTEIVDSFTDADAAIVAIIDALAAVVDTKAGEDATTAALAGKRNTVDDVLLAEVTGFGETGRALAESENANEAWDALGEIDLPVELLADTVLGLNTSRQLLSYDGADIAAMIEGARTTDGGDTGTDVSGSITLPYSPTIGNVRRRATGNVTITGMSPAMTENSFALLFHFRQDATGGRTLTLGAGIAPSGVVPVDAAPNAETTFVVYQVGSQLRFAAEDGTSVAGVVSLADGGSGATNVPAVLTYGGTMTPDLADGLNWSITMGGNATLANPTNQSAGMAGAIAITQDATGSRTLAFGANWIFPGGAPDLSTAANAKDLLTYYVASSGVVFANLLKGAEA